MTKAKRVSINHSQFFQVCEQLRNDQETVLRDCHTLSDVRKFVHDKLGFEISTNAATDALAAVNITLVAQQRYGGGVKQGGNNSRILAKAVLGLYEKLGETPPASLVHMWKRLSDGHNAPVPVLEPPAAPPSPVPQQPFAVPVKTPAPIPSRTIVDPKTIPLVNGRR